MTEPASVIRARAHRLMSELDLSPADADLLAERSALVFTLSGTDLVKKVRNYLAEDINPPEAARWLTFNLAPAEAGVHARAGLSPVEGEQLASLVGDGHLNENQERMILDFVDEGYQLRDVLLIFFSLGLDSAARVGSQVFSLMTSGVCVPRAGLTLVEKPKKPTSCEPAISS